jgi:hypothetical protein
VTLAILRAKQPPGSIRPNVVVIRLGENTRMAAYYAGQAELAIADAANQAVIAAMEADRAESAVYTIENIRRSVLLNADLPIGFIEPNDFTGVSWASGFAHKRYCDGMAVWCMLPDDSTTREEWRIGTGPRARHPDDGIYYVAVNMAAVYNPTLQGTAATVRWVDVNTGNNANVGTEAAPYKTVPYAIGIVNGLGAGTYQINVKSADFIPSNSEGWDASTYTINANVKLSIVILPKGDGQQPWYLPGMRRSGYLKPNFAWSSIGGGWWKCITGSISAAAKNTPVVFDLSVHDPDGAPTPSLALTGTLADDAAVIAAGAGRPAFYRRVSDNHFYVKLASGAEPDPGVNFAYVENQAQLTMNLSEGARLHIKGLREVNNTSVSNLHGIQLRPTTVALGPTQPVVVHDIQAVLEDCEIYGTSGNAIVAFDVNRCVIWNCRSAYNWLDAVNQSSFYTPGNSNGTAMGSAQHMLVYGHVDSGHGPNGFKDQPTVNTSANGPTTHSRCNMEVIDSRFAGSNGSNAAVVGGAQMLPINVGLFDPKNVTPGADVYPACQLSSGNSAYDVNIKSAIYGLYCTGAARPFGRDFYVGPTAKMIQAHYRKRSFTKQVDSGGVLQDGYGGAM